MSECDLVHISEAGFRRIIWEREAALDEAKTLEAENERLLGALRRIRECVASGWASPDGFVRAVAAIIDEAGIR